MPEVDQHDADRLKISLLENGLHSLKRGLEAYSGYKSQSDKMLLKDAVMFLHHGIELLMKQILVNKSEYLIFDDLKKITDKRKQANDKKCDIFELQEPPYTITYDEAIKRVHAFIQPDELTVDCQNSLKALNSLRNQMEHYAIDVSIENVTKVIGDVRKPIDALFQSHLPGYNSRLPTKTKRTWQKAELNGKLISHLENTVFQIMRLFGGQQVPGSLLGIDGEVTLPNFSAIAHQVEIEPLLLKSSNGQYHPDIVGRGSDEAGHPISWVVELTSRPHDSILRLSSHMDVAKATLWLVSATPLSTDERQSASEKRFMVSGPTELQQLEQILTSTKSASKL